MKTKCIEIEVVENGMIVRVYPFRPNFASCGPTHPPLYVFTNVEDLKNQLADLLNHEC